jgi:L-alanine-DL-glutamate epimerase-like enolase superfamily enzyme
MANAQAAMAMENFVALEMHSVDNPWWNDLVTMVGQDGPMIKNGYVQVTDAPGLGLELNEEVIAEHLAQASGRRQYGAYPSGAFEDTSDWDELDAHDRVWS